MDQFKDYFDKRVGTRTRNNDINNENQNQVTTIESS